MRIVTICSHTNPSASPLGGLPKESTMTLRRIYLFFAVALFAFVITAIIRLSTAKAEVNAASADVLKDSQSPQRVPLPKSVIGALGVMAYVITEVRTGSAAEQAGLQSGDIVTHLDEQIASIQDFQGKIANSEPGTFFTIKYRRFNRSTGSLEEHTGTIQTRPFQASVPPQNGYLKIASTAQSCPYGCCYFCTRTKLSECVDAGNFTGKQCFGSAGNCSVIFCT